MEAAPARAEPAAKRLALPHVPQLDGMRAIAILLVFVAHCGLDKIVPGGFGVTVFFFLSGYLITSLLRAEAAQAARIDLVAFYIRRTLRIWPSLYLTMAVVALCAPLVAPGYRMDPWGVLAQLAFVTNYADLWGHPNGVPGMPLWSLAIEEHFYLVFPPLFAVLFVRRSPRVAAAWCAAACLAVLLVRLASAPVVEDIGRIYGWSHTRIDSILFGCGLALWNNPVMDESAWRPRWGHAAAAMGVLLVCLLVRGEWFRQTLRYTLQGGALFVIFSFVLWDRGWLRGVLSSRPMRLIGLYSYTLYLVHLAVIEGLRVAVPTLSIPGMLLAAGALAMSYAALMYRFVEGPLARRRRAMHAKGAPKPSETPARGEAAVPMS